MCPHSPGNVLHLRKPTGGQHGGVGALKEGKIGPWLERGEAKARSRDDSCQPQYVGSQSQSLRRS